MIFLSNVTMWFAMAFLAGATVLYAYHFLSKRAAFSWYASFLTGAAFLCLTASIGLHSSALEGTRLWGPYSLVLASWAIVLTYFAMEHVIKIKVYGTVLVPLALIGLVVAQVMGAVSQGTSPSAAELALIDNWRITLHVALIVFANAGFAIGGAASGAYLAMATQLKRHRTSTLFRRLPSLGQTASVARRAIAFAFPVYSGGLLLGVLRAVETDVAGWWADPRVILSGAVLAVFGTYLYLSYGRDTSDKSLSRLALAGLVFVIALAIVARTVPTGFHIFAVGA